MSRPKLSFPTQAIVRSRLANCNCWGYLVFRELCLGSARTFFHGAPIARVSCCRASNKSPGAPGLGDRRGDSKDATGATAEGQVSAGSADYAPTIATLVTSASSAPNSATLASTTSVIPASAAPAETNSAGSASPAWESPATSASLVNHLATLVSSAKSALAPSSTTGSILDVT